MIQEKDVDIFIKAKKDQLVIDVFQGLSLLSLITLIALEALQLIHDYTIVLATMATVFMGAAMGQSRWIAVSRSKLLQTLEGIINNDSEGLKILAEKRRPNRSIT